MSNKLDGQYNLLLKDILDNGVKKGDRTGTGTISVFGREIRHKMSDGFPLITTKKMHFKSIATELVWFLMGDTNIKFLVENNCNIWNGDAYKNHRTKLKGHYESGGDCATMEEFINFIKTDDEFAKKWGELGPIYGKQWRDWDGVDQIKNLIHDLRNNPDSRRLMVNAWNVPEIPTMILPPCHYGFQCYTTELTTLERSELYHTKMIGLLDTANVKTDKDYDNANIPKRKLSLMWNQRSVDTPLGLPFNIASYGLLLEILAKKTNMAPHELIGVLGDTHIYLNQIEGCREQLTRIPYDLPKIKLDDDFNWNNFDIKVMLDWMSIKPDDWFKLENYVSHPTIKFPLSN